MPSPAASAGCSRWPTRRPRPTASPTPNRPFRWASRTEIADAAAAASDLRHVIEGSNPLAAALPLTRMKTSPSLPPGSLGAAPIGRREHGEVHVARPPLRLRRTRAAHQRDDHGAAPRQAPPGVRDRREHRARAAGRGARHGQPRERQQAREGPRVQPRRAHEPLDLLDQPLAGRRRQARPATSSPPSTTTSARSTSSGPLHRRRARRAGLGLGGAVLGLDRREPDHPAVLRPAVAVRGRAPCRCSCSTCGSTRTTSTTRTSRADYVKAFWNIANWANVQDRFTVAREKTAGLLVLS